MGYLKGFPVTFKTLFDKRDSRPSTRRTRSPSPSAFTAVTC